MARTKTMQETDSSATNNERSCCGTTTLDWQNLSLKKKGKIQTNGGSETAQPLDGTEKQDKNVKAIFDFWVYRTVW